MIRRLLLLLALLLAAPALAQDFPPLSGRVVDTANLLSDEQEYELTQRLAALEAASSRQLVVATVPSLQDREIEDYGYRLGRHWGIGQSEASNGVILLVAPNERKVRIEVGYGLEGILTDALTGQIIRDRILPRFRDNDYPGGIMAGAQEIMNQLQAPPEVAEQRALAAQRSREFEGRSIPFSILLAFAGILVFMFLAPWAINTLERSHDRAYRKSGRRRRRRDGSVWIWGPGWGGGSGGWSGGGGSWGGWSGGGGGGFSGGGGSFGGGGASGSW